MREKLAGDFQGVEEAGQGQIEVKLFEKYPVDDV